MNRWTLLAVVVLVAGAAFVRMLIAPTSSGRLTSAATPAPGEVVLLRDAGASAGGVLAVDAMTGRTVRVLPAGTTRPGSSRLYVATPDGTATRVVALDPATGATVAETRLTGRFGLPQVGPDGLPGGLSADGRRLVLNADPATGAGAQPLSRFAVLDVARLALVREFALAGSFSYDALAPDGSVVYLLEYLTDPAGRYQVRAYDVAAGRLRDGIVVDKLSQETAMEGVPVAQTTSADGGWSYTLYRSRHHAPFIHALDTRGATAVCIDLPADGESWAVAAGWGLAMSPDGRRLYAANGLSGQAFGIDTTQLTITPPATFPSTAEAAALGSTADPLAGRRVAVAADGKTVYVAGARGVTVLDAATLARTGEVLAGRAVRSLLIGTGGRLFGLVQPGALVAVESVAAPR